MSYRSLDGLAGEMRDHIERETRDNIERGMSPADARRAALRAFGNTTAAAEDTRAVWIPVWLEHAAQDARAAFRAVRRNPIFSIIVVLTLAVGIGLTTAVFSVFRAVLLRPLDYPEPDRLVSLSLASPTLPNDEVATNWDYWEWREQASSFDRLIAYTSYDQTLTAGTEASRVRVASVTEDFWTATGAHAIAGRLPNPGERNVAVIAEQFFTTRFSRDASVVGRAVTLERTQVTIIGVVPAAFRFQLVVPRRPGFQPKHVEVYRSFNVGRPEPTFAQILSIVGRLKPGADSEGARAELTAIHARRPANPNDPNGNVTIRVTPVQERLVRDASVALKVLLAGVVFVMLVAWANVADLLLARVFARQKEMAIRVSVGAGRGRLLRQFLFESLLYSTLGGLGAILFARWGLSAIVGIYPHAVPRLSEASIDGPILLAAFAVLAVTAILFGLIPAVAIHRANVHDILKDGARATTSTPARVRLRRVLSGAQLALAVSLLTGAGLMIKSFWQMNSHPPGFDPARILMMRVDFPASQSPRARVNYIDLALARIQALPGVQAASINSHGDLLTRLAIEGAPRPAPEAVEPPVFMNQTSAGFDETMGLRMVKGRWLGEAEPAPVIVLNETLARQMFGDVDPVGQRVENTAVGDPGDNVRQDPNPSPTVATVVGVVADLRYTRLDEESQAEFYVPYSHARGIFRLTLVVRAAGDPLALVPSIRSAINEIDARQKPFDIMTLEQSLSDSIAPRRFNLFVLVTFAGTALLLALVGIYGVMSYSVVQRTHELGIRSALGAQRARVVGMVVGQGMTVAAVALVVGIAVALALTRAMSSLLFQVEPTDPQTFVAVSALMGLTALLACVGPALKAALLDPLIVLRHE